MVLIHYLSMTFIIDITLSTVSGPSSPPLNVTIHSITSTSIVVSWQPPPSDTLNGELQKYEVLLEKAALDECLSSSLSSSNTGTLASTVSKRASLSSTSSPSSTIKLQISSSVGLSIPEIISSSAVQTTAQSSSTVIPTTIPIEPTKPTELPERPLLLVGGLVDAGKNLSKMLVNLEVFTCYSIQVRAVTSSPGPWSAKILAKTRQDSKLTFLLSVCTSICSCKHSDIFCYYIYYLIASLIDY